MTNEDKLKIINSYIEYLCNPEHTNYKNTIIKNLSEISGCKLYKYRTIDCNTLSNLNSQTLHCSKPSIFNDPFDCKVGLDIQSFVFALFGENFESFRNCISNFKDYISNPTSSNKYSPQELSIFKSWEPFTDETKCFSNQNNFSLNKGNDVKDIIRNSSTFLNLIPGYIDGLGYDQLFNNLIKSNLENLNHSTIEHIFLSTENNEPTTALIEKLCCDNTDEIAQALELYKTLLPQLKLKDNVNKEDIEKIQTTLQKAIDSHFRVGCLSTSYTNRVMWSNYADKHKGFCIEYDFTNVSLNEFSVLPIMYTEKRPKFPWDIVLQKHKKTSIAPPKEEIKPMIFTLCTKDSQWEFEDEWRIIITKTTNNDDISIAPISCVYLGALCTEKDTQKILKKVPKGVPVKKMVLNHGEYNIYDTEYKIENMT